MKPLASLHLVSNWFPFSLLGDLEPYHFANSKKRRIELAQTSCRKGCRGTGHRQTDRQAGTEWICHNVRAWIGPLTPHSTAIRRESSFCPQPSNYTQVPFVWLSSACFRLSAHPLRRFVHPSSRCQLALLASSSDGYYPPTLLFFLLLLLPLLRIVYKDPAIS